MEHSPRHVHACRVLSVPDEGWRQQSSPAPAREDLCEPCARRGLEAMTLRARSAMIALALLAFFFFVSCFALRSHARPHPVSSEMSWHLRSSPSRERCAAIERNPLCYQPTGERQACPPRTRLVWRSLTHESRTSLPSCPGESAGSHGGAMPRLRMTLIAQGTPCLKSPFAPRPATAVSRRGFISSLFVTSAPRQGHPPAPTSHQRMRSTCRMTPSAGQWPSSASGRFAWPYYTTSPTPSDAGSPYPVDASSRARTPGQRVSA